MNASIANTADVLVQSFVRTVMNAFVAFESPAKIPNVCTNATIRPHLDLWAGNIVSQWHPFFTSPYAGMNSLSAEAQDASSRVLTLFTGLRLTGSLALGGYGFSLGDGRLRYGRETAEEAYYTVHLWRGAYPSIGVQHIITRRQSRSWPGRGSLAPSASRILKLSRL
jgi:hypothetical protein